MGLFEELVKLAASKGATISACESLTAGMFCASVADVPGASAVLKGGLITYFTEMKEVLAHVAPEIIKEYGVVSGECALAMALNTCELTGSDFCVSVTGNAGPGVLEGKQAGLVYCGLADREGAEVFKLQLHGTRNEVRSMACRIMAGHLIERLNQYESLFSN